MNKKIAYFTLLLFCGAQNLLGSNMLSFLKQTATNPDSFHAAFDRFAENDDPYWVNREDEKQLKALGLQIKQIVGVKSDIDYGVNDFGNHIPDNVQLMKKIAVEVGIFVDCQANWSQEKRREIRKLLCSQAALVWKNLFAQDAIKKREREVEKIKNQRKILDALLS